MQDEKCYNLPLHGGQVYQNPLPFSDPGRTNPDPFVMKHRGIYYCYSSDAGGVNVSCSPDLVHWEYQGYAITEPGRQEYWAPCAYYVNGLFYLYYSTAPAGDFDCHQEELRVAVSETPVSGFRLERVLLEAFAIDAHVVRDTNGEFHLFYSPNAYLGTDEDAAGTVILVDRMTDPVTLEGCPKEVVIPSLEEEIYAKNRFGDGRDWHTIEGAFYFTHHDKAYLMFSANAFVHENYFIGYSMAEKDGPIGALRWRKHLANGGYDPLVRRNEVVEGTGHNSVAKAPNLVDDWIVYHGRNCADELIEGTEQRQMRIDPLFYDNGLLVTNAPSYLPQRAPRQPLCKDFWQKTFSQIDSALWETVSGGFAPGEACVRSVSTVGVSLLRLRSPLENYVMEVDTAADPTHMGARWGVMLWYADDTHYLELRLDSGKRTVSFLLCENGVISSLGVTALPREFRPSAYHSIFISRRFDRFDVSLDGVALPSCIAFVPFGGVALFTRYTAARFSAFSLTESISLHGDTLRYFPRLFAAEGAPLRLEDSALCSRSPAPAALRAVHPFIGDFSAELTVSLLREKGSVDWELGGGWTFHGSRESCSVSGPGRPVTVLGPIGDGATVRLSYENSKLLVLVKGRALSLDMERETNRCGSLILQGAAIKDFSLTKTF